MVEPDPEDNRQLDASTGIHERFSTPVTLHLTATLENLRNPVCQLGSVVRRKLSSAKRRQQSRSEVNHLVPQEKTQDNHHCGEMTRENLLYFFSSMARAKFVASAMRNFSWSSQQSCWLFASWDRNCWHSRSFSSATGSDAGLWDPAMLMVCHSRTTGTGERKPKHR